MRTFLGSLLVLLSLIAYPAATAQEEVLQLYAEAITPNGTAFSRLYRLTFNKADLAKPLRLSTLPKPEPAGAAKVRLFYFNDLHGKVVIPNSRRGDTYVFAQMMRLVNNARKQQDASVLFLSAGDDHTGEVYDELLGSDAASFQLSLPYHVYSRAGLDAAVMGNHELDRGLAVFKQKIQQNASFPVLAANIAGSKVLSYPDVVPAVLGEVAGFRVAIIGLTSVVDTKQQADDPGFVVQAALPALERVVKPLIAHTDLVIVLSHLGYQQQGIWGDADLAAELSKLPVPAIVVGGHSHSVLNAAGLAAEHIYQGVPVLQAGSWGHYLGELTFTLQRQDTTSKAALTLMSNQLHTIEPHLSGGEAVDEPFQQQVIAPVLARFAGLLEEVITTVADNQQLSSAIALQQRYIGETVVANLLTDAVFSRQKAFSNNAIDAVAINASGIIGGFAPAQPLRFKDMFAIMPYADELVVVEFTKAQLQQFLDSNAKRIIRPAEQADYDLSSFVNRGFLHFSASLRYQIVFTDDVNTAHATQISINGKPLESFAADQVFRIAMGDYISSGNQGWRGLAIGSGLPETLKGFDITALPSTASGHLLRNEIIQALRNNATANAKPDSRLEVGARLGVGSGLAWGGVRSCFLPEGK